MSAARSSTSRQTLRGDIRRQVFIGKIDHRFEVGQRLNQPMPPGVVAFLERAAHLPQGLARLGGGFRRHQVGQGFGLGQIHFVVLEGTPGELSRLGGPQAGDAAQKRQAELSINSAAAVEMKLGHILAGETVRRRKPQHQSVVHNFRAFRMDKLRARVALRGVRQFRSRAAQRFPRARGPETRTTAMPARPGADASAKIVSSAMALLARFTFRFAAN